MRRTLGALFGVLAFLAATLPSHAAVAPDVLAAARREGTVVWYTSLDPRTLQATVARFEAAYPGIAVATLQVPTTATATRIITEARAKAVVADLATGDGFQLSQLVNAGLIEPYRPSEAAKFIKGAVDPNGYWTSLYQDNTVLAWNTERLRADGLPVPKTFAELTRPEWKGRLGISAGAYNWLSGVLHVEPGADDLLRKFSANKPFVAANHIAVVTQLEAGEYDVTPTAYGYFVELERKGGKPVDFVNFRPALVSLIPIAIVKNAPHPNAARVLLEWLLSKDGQQFIAQQSGRSSSRIDVSGDRKVFDPRAPFFIVPPPDASTFNDVVKLWRDLFGT